MYEFDFTRFTYVYENRIFVHYKTFSILIKRQKLAKSDNSNDHQPYHVMYKYKSP